MQNIFASNKKDDLFFVESQQYTNTQTDKHLQEFSATDARYPLLEVITKILE